MTLRFLRRNRQRGFVQPGARERAASPATAPIVAEANRSLEDVLARLHTGTRGLTFSQAEDRLAQHGANEIAHDRPPHWLRQLLHAFHNPFVYVLLVLAAISFCTDVWFAAPEDRDYVGMTILLSMVTISAVLRFVQEFRSLRAADRLKALVRTTTMVRRRPTASTEPMLREIPIREVVPGDIVQLSAGDMVPADVRLLASRDLFISQAALTGEALPVEKYDTLGAVAGKSAQAPAAAAEAAGDTVDTGKAGSTDAGSPSTSPTSASWVPTW